MASRRSNHQAVAGGEGLSSYRYRTRVLVGPWRATHGGALADALAARQARVEEDGFRWIVDGQVEQAPTEAAARRQAGPGGA